MQAATGKAGAAWIRARMREQYTELLRSMPAVHPESALCLSDIDSRFRILRPGVRLIDLGCAPGGWSSLAWARSSLPIRDRENSVGRAVPRVLGVDTVELKTSTIPTLRGFQAVQATVGTRDCAEQIRHALKGQKVDVVLSDLTFDGAVRRDEMMLALNAAELAESFLRVGGTFVTRLPLGADTRNFVAFLQSRFQKCNTHFVRLQRPAGDEDLQFELLTAPTTFGVGEHFMGRLDIASEVPMQGGAFFKVGSDQVESASAIDAIPRPKYE